ncbi:TraM recognition domain-containing protein [Hymenobacter defluvii]|uniref:Type IV secretory system conjugative DNA transfer family protein n=1 Tax=Hymenobacter defluvii TaxID=2054411 RepID=A0ABS3TF54_9BACT|nr:type IV secretory system conjugative DNA transfer family protein [Hymenobacter defluvii]
MNIPNPFRGTLVFGGAGAGKTYSIGEPMVEQFIQNGMCGLIYDFKFPVLASAAQKAIVMAEQRYKRKKESLLYRVSSLAGIARPLNEVGRLRHHIINFSDMERTEKVNPIRPENMPVIAYAADASKTILKNLNPGTHRGSDDFFEASAGAYLTAIIWFYRQNFPQFCTLPHVVATAVYSNYKHVLSMLSTDTECAALIASLVTAVQEKAGKQLAGVIATLQLALSTINSPEIVWVLSPDEERGEGFSLNLNEPQEPKLLTIGNDASLKATFSPLVALIIGMALKLMNQQHKHPSFVFLDEAATIIIPDLETLPATARSNEVAMVYMTQDKSQMVDALGADKTEVLVSNLNNQLIGKVNSMTTAEYVSKMMGKQDKEMVSVSAGKSQGGATKGSHTNRSLSHSVSFQERSIIQPTDMISLEQGEFVGQTVETDQPFFRATFLRKEYPGKHPIQPFVQFSLAMERAEPNSEKELAEVLSQTPSSSLGAADEQPAIAQLSLLERRKLARQEARRPTNLSVQKRILDKNFELIQEDVYTIIHSFYNRLGAAEVPNNSYQY